MMRLPLILHCTVARRSLRSASNKSDNFFHFFQSNRTRSCAQQAGVERTHRMTHGDRNLDKTTLLKSRLGVTLAADVRPCVVGGGGGG